MVKVNLPAAGRGAGLGNRLSRWSVLTLPYPKHHAGFLTLTFTELL